MSPRRQFCARTLSCFRILHVLLLSSSIIGHGLCVCGRNIQRVETVRGGVVAGDVPPATDDMDGSRRGISHLPFFTASLSMHRLLEKEMPPKVWPWLSGIRVGEKPGTTC
jgi:hypothetical protein